MTAGRGWRRQPKPDLGMPTTPAREDTSLFGVMAQAALTLPGYPVLYIVESRPLPGAERLEVEEGLGRSDPSSRQPAHSTVSQAMVPADLSNIRVSETAFSGFVDGAVDPLIFEVPGGYKKTKSFRYMPDQGSASQRLVSGQKLHEPF